MTLAEQLKAEMTENSMAFPHKDLFIKAVANAFRTTKGAKVAIRKNPPSIDKSHIRINKDGRYWSQKKKYPGKFNYPYDEFLLDADVTDNEQTHLRYYSEEDLQTKAEICRNNGFRASIEFVYGQGTILFVSL